MKWVAISGSRLTNELIETDVRREVSLILKRGDGIVAGGAMGVDYIASDEVLRQGLTKERLKICLPVTLDLYSKHYRNRALEGVITAEEAETLIKQLEKIREIYTESLVENTLNTEVNKSTYFDRHNKILDLAHELMAFHVNKSPGTQDTIDKANNRGMSVKIFTYTI